MLQTVVAKHSKVIPKDILNRISQVVNTSSSATTFPSLTVLYDPQPHQQALLSSIASKIASEKLLSLKPEYLTPDKLKSKMRLDPIDLDRDNISDYLVHIKIDEYNVSTYLIWKRDKAIYSLIGKLEGVALLEPTGRYPQGYLEFKYEGKEVSSARTGTFSWNRVSKRYERRL